jgi:hypothetical protein
MKKRNKTNLQMELKENQLKNLFKKWIGRKCIEMKQQKTKT